MLDVLNPGLQGTLLAGDRMEYRLGTPFAEGGEGRVFAIATRQDVVAKIYKEPDCRREAKLRSLLELSNPSLRAIGAWPMSLLRDSQDSMVGFVMESLRGWRPLYEIYQIRSRVTIAPGHTWQNMLRTARNLAAAVARVHGHGLVIGDLNESNVLVDNQSMVKLIDVDSFQLRDGQQFFECKVGKAELLPPELQGRTLEGIERTDEHDCFALAVLIFQTLVFGRHPFSGRPSGERDIPTEEAIQRGWYAFTERRMTPLRPPPFLNLRWLPQTIRTKFEEAFDPLQTSRPTAEEWFGLLRELESELAICEENPSHRHWQGCDHCPWCGLEDVWSITLFKPSPRRQFTDVSLASDLVWRRIVQMEPPRSTELEEAMLRWQSATWPGPLTRYQRILCKLQRVTKIYAVLAIGYLIAMGLHLMGVPPMILLPIAAVSWLVPMVMVKLAFGRALTEAETAWQMLAIRTSEFQRHSVLPVWEDKSRELANVRDALSRRARRLEHKRETVFRTTYAPQLEAHLAKSSVLAAEDSRLSPESLARLHAKGIQTAAAVNEVVLRYHSRLDGTQIEHLLAWRKRLEFQFWSTSGLQLSSALERELLSHIQSEDNRLLAQLEQGERDLQTLKIEFAVREANFLKAMQPDLERLENSGPLASAYLVASGKRKLLTNL